MLAHRRAERWRRRLLDEPLCVPDRVHRHVVGCRRCGADLAHLRADAGSLAAALDAGAAPDPFADPGAAPLRVGAALARARARAGRDRGAGRDWLRGRLDGRSGPRGRRRAALGALGALGVAVVASGAATGWSRIFHPAAVAPVPVRASDVAAVARLRALGSVTGSTQPTLVPAASLGAAEAATGVSLRLPRALPQGVTGIPAVERVPAWSVTFTFDLARARALARRLGTTLSRLPAGLDGATMVEHAGPGVVVEYGTTAAPSLLGGVPTLALAAVRAPTVDATGVSLGELRTVLLRLPGLSPALRQAIRAFARPATTLPIPVPAGLLQSRRVAVDGRPGVLLSDGSGVVAAVIWEADGLVHGVGGTLLPATVLALARAGD